MKPRDVELQLGCVVGESIAQIIRQNHWIQWLREEASGALGGAVGWQRALLEERALRRAGGC